MWNYIRRKLGIDLVNERLSTIVYTQAQIEEEMLLLRNDLSVTYADELDPRRKDMSEQLGRKMLTKMAADKKVRDQYGPGEGT